MPKPKKLAIIDDQAWPAETTEMVETSRLVPSARNARTHSAEQVKTIADLMLKNGVTTAVLRDDANEIIAGHGRVLGAALNVERGFERFKRLPVMTAHGWTEEQKRAYRIADNQVALMSGWDLGLLRTELDDLHVAGLDLGTLGFSLPELAQIEVPGFTAAEVQERADAVPEKPKKPVVKAGELWTLGEHRLLIGDSTNKGDVERLLAGAVPLLMVTDPPYGVDYDPNWRNEADRASGKAYGASAVGKVQNDGEADWRKAWALFPGDVAYVWHAGRHARTVQESLESVKFAMRSQIIWLKDRLIISRGDYHWKHEPCWYAVRQGRKGHWAGDRKQTTVWEIAHAKSETGHGTQKPIECMRRPIVNNSKRGDAVYDPFLGSGTTLIAAHMEGRRCFGLEIDPAYGQVIIERWQTFSGNTAKREDGATLEDLHDVRWTKKRLKEKLVQGPELDHRLAAITKKPKGKSK